MKKSIFLAILSIALLLTLTCDIYNKSVPDYLDKYTNTASVAEHTFASGTLADPQGRVYSGLIRPDASIDLKLRNPKNYQLLTYLEYNKSGTWIPFTRHEAPGDYSKVENTSGDFSGTVITVKYNPTDQIRISVAGAALGDSYKLRLKINDRETRREFEAYELPLLKCSDYPETGVMSLDIGDNEKGLIVSWQQLLRGASGDFADADELIISCPSLGISQTYTRTFDGTNWSPWTGENITRVGVSSYSVTLAKNETLTTQAAYRVTLRFKNSAGVVREITESLTQGEGVVRVAIGSSVADYTKFELAFTNTAIPVGSTATVTLLKSIRSQAPIILTGNKTITLLSNGPYSVVLDPDGGSLFTVESGTTLKLGGPSIGALTLRGVDNNTAALITVSGGTLELYDNAVITGNKTIGNTGVGIYVDGASSRFNMHGGIIEGNDGLYYSEGGGVLVNTNAQMTMSNGVIRQNRSLNGGGVFVGSTGSITMSGGTIEENTATQHGGGVGVWGGTFTMNDPEPNNSAALIKGNTATQQGGGVYVYGGEFNMNAGNMENNTANYNGPTGGGGGVYVSGYGPGSFTMSGGTIYGSDVPARQNRVAGSTTSGASLYVQGGKAEYDGGYGSGNIIAGGNANFEETLPPYVAMIGSTGYSTLEAAFGAIGNGQTATIEVLKDVPSFNLPNAQGTIQGTNKTINLVARNSSEIILGSATGSMFTIPNTVTLNIGSSSGQTITLRGKNTNNIALITVQNGATFTLNTTARLVGNHNTASGGSTNNCGGAVFSRGTFNLNGGTIGGTNTADQNRATNGGGGVYLVDGQMTMTSGLIEGNTSSQSGGGIGTEVVTTINITMSGGAIRGNNAINGGGVYFVGGTFNMSGGTIGGTGVGEGNTSSNYGGGVCLGGNGAFNLNGNAKIYGNIATSATMAKGGGINIGAGTSFTMSGNAHIYKNISRATGSGTSKGGGICIEADGGTLTTFSASMSGGVIEDNHAEGTFNANGGGGGVYVNDTSFSMSGGVIKDNTTTSNGGGVRFDSLGRNFTMSNSAIIENNSATSGGGVHLNNGTFEMSEGARVTVSSSNNNVFLASGRTITIGASGLAASPTGQIAKIIPSLHSNTTKVLDGNIGTNNTRFDVMNNGTDEWLINESGFLFQAIIEVKIITTATSAVVSTYYTDDLNDAIFRANAVLTTQEAVITMLNNAPMISERVMVSIVRKVTIQSSGASRTISLAPSESGSLLTVGNAGTLILKGQSTTNTLTLSGKGLGITNTDALVYVGSAGTLTIEGNTIISGNYHLDGSKGGGGVRVDGGIFNLNGGSITGNSASKGGGVNIQSGTFNINSGTIASNTTVTDGGGVYVDVGTFTMNGGAIAGNSVPLGSGGGVFVNGGNFILNHGGIIYGFDAASYSTPGSANTASAGGDALYIASGVDAMYDADLGGEQIISGTGSRGINVTIPEEVAQVNTGTTSTIYPSLSSAFNRVLSGPATITVLKDIPSQPAISITGTKTINLVSSVNRTITLFGTGSLLSVGANTTLRIGDSSAVGGATSAQITLSGRGMAAGNENDSSLVMVNTSGTLNLYNNAIIRDNNNTSTTTTGGGVRTQGGTFNMIGGSITGNRSDLGGGVAMQGPFNMSGGTIYENNSTNNGGGVFVTAGQTFTMTGGIIGGNTAANNGGGVYVNIANFTMSGTPAQTAIRGNRAIAAAGLGGGVFLAGASNFTMNGGIIYGSDAGTSIANTAPTHATLYADTGSTVMYGTALGGGNILATIPGGTSDNLPEQVVQVVTTGAYYPTLLSAFNSITSGTETVTVFKDIPNQPAISVIGTKTINLVSSQNRTITLASTGSLLTIGTGTTLRIGDSSGVTGGAASAGTLTFNGRGIGAADPTNSASLITVSGGILGLYSNSIISNNKTSANGGGVNVTSGGQVSMNGTSIIRNNTVTLASGFGGGIYSDGSLSNSIALNNGTISGNSAPYGGGVYSLRTITMSNGTISGNNAGAGGGGIVVAEPFTMSNGTISGNEALWGGGVVVMGNAGNFTMNGGTIGGNRATSGDGGGVYVATLGTFTLNSGSIIYGSDAGSYSPSGTANTATGSGASLYIDTGGLAYYGTTLGGGEIIPGTGNIGTNVTIPEREAQVGTIVYPSLAAAINSVTGTGTVSVLRNVTAPARIEITGSGGTITLENNTTPAKTITLLGTSGSLFRVNGAGRTLVVRGSSTANTLTLVGKPSNNAAFVLVNNGTFELSANAIIENNVNIANFGTGGGVFVDGANATLTLSGGIIRGCKVTGATSSWGGGVLVAAGGTFTMTSGTIGGTATGAANEASCGGGGVYVANGTFNMNTPGGNITNNTANNNGGGVAIENNGTFNMNAGTIQGNAANSGSSGGGVYVFGGQMSMTGGTIGGATPQTRNSAVYGGGIYYNSSTRTLQISGGTIRNNAASSTNGSGGGIFLGGGNLTINNAAVQILENSSYNAAGVHVDSGTFTFSAGTISGNAATNNGGGVVFSSGTTFNMSGTAAGTVISGNSAVSGGGVYFGGTTFNMTGGTIGGSAANSTNTATNGAGVYVAAGTFTLGTNGLIEGNIAETSGGGVFVSTGSFALSGGVIQGNTGKVTGGGVYSSTTFTMSSGRIYNNDTALTANRSGGGVYMLSGNFTMSGGQIERNISNNGGGVYFTGGGTFSMNTPGGTIGGTAANTANTASTSGGGVYINNGVFNINAGTIAGNSASTSGGGVYKTGTGLFTMSNGQIQNNTTPTTAGCIGGGVHIAGGNFTLSGGTMQSNSSYNGGGVYFGGTTFSMTSGTIGGTGTTRNTASNGGGGVYMNAGTFNMSAGNIDGNTATNFGGGVWSRTTFNMSGGTIANCTTPSSGGRHGGGVYMTAGGTFDFSGGTIHTNSAWDGGGVYLFGQTGNTVLMTMRGTATGTVIRGNTGGSGGAGVFVGEFATFNMQGGTIGGTTAASANKAGMGAGVLVNPGTFNMSGGVIEYNEGWHGGGVLVGGKFEMGGTAVIRNNLATSGSGTAGGGVRLAWDKAEMIMTGGTIGGPGTPNTAQSGGGVSIDTGSIFDMRGGSIEGNKGLINGGGVHLESGAQFLMSGGNVYGNNFATVNRRNTSDDGTSASIYVTASGARYVAPYAAGPIGTTNNNLP